MYAIIYAFRFVLERCEVFQTSETVKDIFIS